MSAPTDQPGRGANVQPWGRPLGVPVRAQTSKCPADIGWAFVVPALFAAYFYSFELAHSNVLSECGDGLDDEVLHRLIAILQERLL